MINVAIVEDENDAAETLAKYLKRYGEQDGEQFRIRRYKDAVTLVADYTPCYDILFMDIMMPDLDGLAASHKIREKDSKVIIIFVTNMSQFAVRGYEVDALDFIVKPLSFYDFRMKIRRAVFAVRNRDEAALVIPSGNQSIRLLARDLIYVEVNEHKCVYHTTGGVIEGRNSINKLAEKLSPYHFMRCNSCYLVNPLYISYVSGYTLVACGDELQISHPRKKTFMREFNEWIAGGGGGTVL